MVTIAHIINPYKPVPQSEHGYTQPLVFESLIHAKQYARHKNNIQLYTVQYEEDAEIIPDAFIQLPNLQRSISDIHQFSKPRKFPLIQDILATAYQHAQADYFIFTNTDIIAMPFFYDAIMAYIQQGYDAFTINRRRISKQYLQETNLNLLYAEVGKSHPGFDCFVFKKSLLPKFHLGNICVGVPFLEASLLYNLIAHAHQFKSFTDKHVTLHVGMDVMPNRNPEYHKYNQQQFFDTILPQLKPLIKTENLPYSKLSLLKRIFKWGLNPAVFTFVNTELEAKDIITKLRLVKDEIRFKWLERE